MKKKNSKELRKREKHGDTNTAFHKRWMGMRHRCYMQTGSAWRNYGAKGIKVCSRWHSYLNFKEDMIDGFSPELEIDRIDSCGHYSCGKCEECIENGWAANCQWITVRENRKKTRRTMMLTIGGVTKSVSDFAFEAGISAEALRGRVKSRWPEELLLNPPLPWGRPRKNFHRFLSDFKKETSNL